MYTGGIHQSPKQRAERKEGINLAHPQVAASHSKKPTLICTMKMVCHNACKKLTDQPEKR